MKIALSAILTLAVLAAPAPLATGDDQAPASEQTAEEDEGTLEEFIPSEEVPADSAISFPVDI